jgi:hypothetical protein
MTEWLRRVRQHIYRRCGDCVHHKKTRVCRRTYCYVSPTQATRCSIASSILASGANRKKVRSLDATGRWQELALLVMQVGYTNDLSHYYLGHSAENLGYWRAAQRYYRIAERLSVTQMS